MLIYVTCEHSNKVFDSNTCGNAREKTAGEAGKKKSWWNDGNSKKSDWLYIQ